MVFMLLCFYHHRRPTRRPPALGHHRHPMGCRLAQHQLAFGHHCHPVGRCPVRRHPAHPRGCALPPPQPHPATLAAVPYRPHGRTLSGSLPRLPRPHPVPFMRTPSPMCARCHPRPPITALRPHADAPPPTT